MSQNTKNRIVMIESPKYLFPTCTLGILSTRIYYTTLFSVNIYLEN